jgi:putative transposase
MAESFFATLECELIDRRSWPSKAEARHRQHASHRQTVEHGLPTVGACVACATPPVDNPAPVLIEDTEHLST